MKRLLQRALFWALTKTGWKPEEKIHLLRVREFRKRLWSGNAHQRRIMTRAWKQAYPAKG